MSFPPGNPQDSLCLLSAILKSRSLFLSTLPWPSLGYYHFLHSSAATVSWETHTTIPFPILSDQPCFPEVNLLPSPYFTFFITDKVSWQWHLTAYLCNQSGSENRRPAIGDTTLTRVLFIWTAAVRAGCFKAGVCILSWLVLPCGDSLFCVRHGHPLSLKHLSSGVRCLQQQLHLTGTETSCPKKQSHIQGMVAETISAARLGALMDIVREHNWDNNWAL